MDPTSASGSPSHPSVIPIPCRGQGPGLLSCPAFSRGPAYSPGCGHTWRTRQPPGTGPGDPAVDRAAAVGNGPVQRASGVATEIEGAGRQGPEAESSASATARQSWSGGWRCGSQGDVSPRQGLSPGGKLNVGPFKMQDTNPSLGPRSCWQGCRGQGPGLAYVPVPSGVPSCPETLPTSQWALNASRNSSRSLDIAVITLEQCQHLVQSCGVCGGEPGGVTGYHGLAMGLQETHSIYGPPLSATADPGYCKLHGNPGLGDVASCKGVLGHGHRGSCASNCADHPAFPLGYMSACYMSVHC